MTSTKQKVAAGATEPPAPDDDRRYRVTILSARASGGIGRRAGFRFLCPQGREGSSPSSPTTSRTFVQTGSVDAASDDGVGPDTDDGVGPDLPFNVKSSLQTVAVDAASADPASDCPADGDPVKAVDGELAAIAPLRAGRTVDGMPATSTLHHKAQTDLTLRRLGRLGGTGEAPSRTGRPHLHLVPPAAPTRVVAPVTAFTRTVDRSGRLKLTGASVPSAWLGWQPGPLAVHAFEGWLVIRQPTPGAGAVPGRFGTAATLSLGAGGAERITLRPAHLELVGLPQDRQLLIAVFQSPDALVVVSPQQMFSAIPDQLGRVLSPGE